MKKNRLYYFILLACLAGYVWLFYSINKVENSEFSVCLIKNTTGIPCPSCGTTRAVTEIIKGQLLNSICTNPFGAIVLIIMTVAPIWIVFDMISKKSSFYHFYKKTEKFLSRKGVAIFLIILVLLNWYWNIKKGL